MEKEQFTQQQISKCQQQFRTFIDKYKLINYPDKYQELKQLSLQQFIQYLANNQKRPKQAKRISMKTWTYQQQVSYIAFLKHNLSQLNKRAYKTQKLMIFHHLSNYLKVAIKRIYKHHSRLLTKHKTIDNIIDSLMTAKQITDQQISEEIQNQKDYQTKLINHPLYSTRYSLVEKEQANAELLKTNSHTSPSNSHIFSAFDLFGLINPSKKKLKEEWRRDQNIKFLIFIKANIHLFSIELKQNKRKAIFEPMSKYIVSRNSQQCADHFKYLKFHKQNINAIIQYLYQICLVLDDQGIQIQKKVEQCVKIKVKQI